MERWSLIRVLRMDTCKKRVPSRNVLSITGNDTYVYFGTTGGVARIERSYWNGSTLKRFLPQRRKGAKRCRVSKRFPLRLCAFAPLREKYLK